MDPYIMKGIGQGFQQATATLLQVSLKKRQLEKEDKEFNIGMKMKKLQLEALQEKMSPEQLEYNKTLQGLEIKKHKLRNEETEFGLKKMRIDAEIYQKATKDYLEGIRQGETDGLREGFELGGQMYNLDLGSAAGFKRVSPTQQLSREKATEELTKRREAETFREEKIPGTLLQVVEPHQLIKRMKPEFAATNEVTKREIEKIETFNDLITFYENSLELEEEGVNVEEIVNYYTDEFAKLREKGLI